MKRIDNRHSGRPALLLASLTGLLAVSLIACQLPVTERGNNADLLRRGGTTVSSTGGATGRSAAESHSAAQAASTQSPVEVKIVTKEWTFTPRSIKFPAGRQVSLVLDNQGQLEHDVTIPALGVRLVAQPGKTARTTVNVTQAGEYEVVCSLPGHKEAGMTAKMTAAVGAAPSQEEVALEKSAITASAHASHAATVATARSGNEELAYTLVGDTKHFQVTLEHVKWEVIPGEFVEAFAYNGQVPGPVIRVTEGDKVRVEFANNLPEDSVVHFHGPRIPNAMDGVVDVTQKVIKPGERFAYEFVANPSGTFLYHTHHNSAVQEPKGLYGMFIVEPKNQVKNYDREYVQVLSETGGFFVINGKSFPATDVIEAKVGERILLRLANLGQMPHPMHLHGHPFKIVATDGFPVPEGQALTKDVVNIGPGERYDLLIELDNPGVWVFHCHILSHVQNRGVEPGGMITVIKVNP